MSNPIYIVDLEACGIETPADTLSGLWQQIEPHLNAGKPSDKYIELARRVEAYVKARAGRRTSQQTVSKRLDQPLEQARSLDSAVWAYGLPDEEDGVFDAGRVLHAVVLKAMELDLLVLADHLGVAFLPGQELVDESGSGEDVDWNLLFDDAAPDLEEDEKPAKRVTVKQAAKKVLKIVEAKLAGHGFRLTDEKRFSPYDKKGSDDTHYFVRENSDNRQLITVYLWTERAERLTVSIKGGVIFQRLRPIFLVKRKENGRSRESESIEARRRNENLSPDFDIDLNVLGAYRRWYESDGEKGSVKPAELWNPCVELPSTYFDKLDKCLLSFIDVSVGETVKVLDELRTLEQASEFLLSPTSWKDMFDFELVFRNRFAVIAIGYLCQNPALLALVEEFKKRIDEYRDLPEKTREEQKAELSEFIDFMKTSADLLPG